MKSVTLTDLEGDLARAPEDWSLRLRLVEGYILEGDKENARRLVRESPDDSPLPHELQFRLHTVMTQGAAGVQQFYEENGKISSPFVCLPDEDRAAPPEDTKPERKVDEKRRPEKSVEDSVGKTKDSLEKDKAKAKAKPADEPNVPKSRPKIVPPKGGKLLEERSSSGKIKRSPVEQDVQMRKAKALDDVALKKRKPVAPVEPEGFVFAKGKGDEEDEQLAPIDRQAQTGLKVSAFTMALVVHICLALLGGFIAIGLPRIEPPKIIAVNVMAETEPVIAPRLVEKEMPRAASASAQPAPVISTATPSDFAVPEFDVNSQPDLTSLLTGIDAGEGMSLIGEERESNVNFFGIRAGGKRIAFVVDTTRYMLLDEKGGMFAYDKVKNEVGAMLAGLNRGTAFNIILYDGRNISLYQEEPVAAKPSTIRLAVEWLGNINNNYEKLGLSGRQIAARGVAADVGIVEARDTHSYAKAIQVALEMDVNAVFAIASGYRRISRSLSPEQTVMVREMRQGGTPGKVSAGDREKWNNAQEQTREWLRKENSARESKGLAPKVVVDFNALVAQVTGERPPRAQGGTANPNVDPADIPRAGPPYTQEEIEKHFEQVVAHFFQQKNKAVPEIHMVLFLGDDEDIGDDKAHFRRLTKKHKGKLQILKGLAALSDVTAE